jgi:hypothetical protein
MNKYIGLFSLIAHFGHFILGVNVFLFFMSYRKKTTNYKIIAFYLLYILIIELVTSYLASFGLNNLVYSHFYFVGQLVFLSFFFMQEFKNSSLSNGINTYLILALISIGIYYLLYPDTVYKFNVFEILLSSIPIVVYSFIFLKTRMMNTNQKFIYFNSGLFIYLLCSTLLFASGNLKGNFKIYVWYINVILLMIYRLCIMLEWFKNFRTNNTIASMEKH